MEFNIDDDLWDAINWKTSNKANKKDVKDNWIKKVESLKSPTWSDGASLTKFIKQTALGFNDAWLDILKSGVRGTASVTYYEDSTEGLKESDDVYAYLADEKDQGAIVKLGEYQNQGYDEYITVGNARRLGYTR